MRSCLTRAELGAMLLGSLSADALSEAQAHLAGCARCRSELAPLLDPAKPEPREQSGADRMLGPYRTIRSIGRGGQGEVFLAEDTRLGRKVALKVLLAPDLSAQVVKRFHREALAASKLDHPGICTVYEAGEIDGILYIAMRYVDGRSLFEVCSDDRTDIRRTLRIVERAGRALHCAHEAGLVHRDVKPRNILVTGEDEPVIVDFGLAHEESQDIEKLTLSGDVLGTPAYMSPEQLRGHHSRVDRRTDVYSLGVMLFQCLTGKLPFEADSGA